MPRKTKPKVTISVVKAGWTSGHHITDRLPQFEVKVKDKTKATWFGQASSTKLVKESVDVDEYSLSVAVLMYPPTELERLKKEDAPINYEIAIGTLAAMAFTESPILKEHNLSHNIITPLQTAIVDYHLGVQEPQAWGTIQDYFFPPAKDQEPIDEKDIDPNACHYFGELLKGILEAAGYDVVIEVPQFYYPAPAQMGFMVPAFGMGLQKRLTPEDIIEGYQTKYVYLSHEKPKSKIYVQLNLLDDLPEERLEKIERTLREKVSPYGLKCLYLVLQGCARNRRQNWMVLDSNDALDALGHTRDSRGVHYTRNRKRLLLTIEELTQINFNVEARSPAPDNKRKEQVNRFIAPLLSLNGKFETWVVTKGAPAEKGKLIKDGVVIYFHNVIYNYITDKATTVPNAFLKIDARQKPHAILLYAYIFNQWRIGWHEYKGTIRQPLRQILDGAGLLKRLPKRKNQQRDFISSIIEDFRWLRRQPEFWIKSVRTDTQNRAHLDYRITVEMADDHPFRTSMMKHV